MRENISIKGKSASFFNFKSSESLTGDRNISVAELDQFQGFIFAPTAARNVDLPVEEACKGQLLLIGNKAGGAYTLTIRDDADSTICTIAQNKTALLFCDGVAWIPMSGA